MTIQNTAPNLFVAQEFIRGYTQIKIVHNTPTDLDIATREVWDGSNVRTSFPYAGEDFIVLTGLSEDTSYDYKFALSDDFVNASTTLLDAQATNPTVLNVASYTFSTLQAPTISSIIVEEVSTGYRTAPSTITVELGEGEADFVEIQAQKQGDTKWTVVGTGEVRSRSPVSLSPGSYKFRVRGYIRELNEYSSWSAETAYYEVEKIGKSSFDNTVSEIIDGVDPSIPGNIYETVAGIKLDTDYLNRNSQDIEKVVFDLTNDYSVFRNENENRLAFVDKVITTQFEVNETDGTITALANQYTDTIFSQASLEIDGVKASIELNTQLIEYESDRITAAESELVLLSDQISLKTTTSEVNEIVSGAIEALTPAYSYQFNSDGESWTGVYTHDSQGFLTQDDSMGIASPTLSFDVAVDPIVRFRIRRPASGSGTWQGTLKLYAGDPAVDADAPDFVIPEAAENGEWATVSIDVSNYVDDPAYADPLIISQVLINTCSGCDIDFVEIGKKQSNQLQLDDITARTTTIELDMDSGTGRMAQYATTTWVDNEGYQTTTDVKAAINSFDAEHSITATLELLDSNDTLNKANTAATWVDGANATIRNQVIAFNAEPDGIDDTLAEIDQSLTTINTEIDAVNGKVQTNISSVYGLELDVRDAGLADVLHEYNNLVNKLGLEQEKVKLATATQELTALATDSEAVATQVLNLQTQFNEASADIVTLYQAFSNEQQATAIREQTLRAEIAEGDTAAVAEANEYTRASVGYCVDSNGNTVSEPDAVACVGAGHSWVEGPLAEFIRNLQIEKNGNSASINDLRQVFEDVNGSLVARGGMVSDVNGKLNGWLAYNDGQSGNFDILADTFAVGNYENSVYVPKIYWDGSQLVVKGKVVLGDNYEVNSENDIRALDGGYYETRYRKNPTSPSTPTGNTPSGWTVSPPVRAAGEIVWATTGFKDQAGDLQGSWSIPTEWSGVKGDPGQSVTVQDNGNGTYTITGANGNVVVSDGADAPIPVVEDLGGGNYKLTVDGNSVTWSHGEDGHSPVLGVDYFYNGRFYSTIYRPSTSTPSTPTGGSFNGSAETVPTSWNDSYVYTDGQTTYVSTTVYSQDPNSGTWTNNGWSSPKPYSVKGADGQSVSVADNGDGTYTLTGANGSVVVSDGADAPIPTVQNLGGGNYRLTVDGNYVDWSDGEDGYTPVLGVDYFYNGRFHSNIYKVSSSPPSTPAGGSFDGSSETVPTGWSDTPVYTEGQITYIATAVYIQDPNNGTWSKESPGWSEPKPYIIKGDTGETLYTWYIYADSVTLDSQNRATSYSAVQGVSFNPTSSTKYVGVSYYNDSTSRTFNVNNYQEFYWTKYIGDDGESAILYTNSTDIALPSTGSTIRRSFNSSYSGPALLSIQATDMEGDVQVGLNSTEIATLPSANNETRWYHFNVEVVSGTNNIDFYGASTFGRIIREVRVSTAQAGDRGAGRYTVGTSTGAWSDTTANNTVPGRTPVQDDVVTIYKTSDPSVQETRRFNNGSWTSFALHVHGDALIEGTLQADRLVAGSITADRIASDITFSKDATFQGTVYANEIEGDVVDVLVSDSYTQIYDGTETGEKTIFRMTVDPAPAGQLGMHRDLVIPAIYYRSYQYSEFSYKIYLSNDPDVAVFPYTGGTWDLIINKSLFAATPYGSLDVIPPQKIGLIGFGQSNPTFVKIVVDKTNVAANNDDSLFLPEQALQIFMYKRGTTLSSGLNS